MPVPLAVTLNVLLLPEQIVTLCGWPEIDANEFTVNVAEFEVAGEVQLGLETTTLYRYPFIVVFPPVIVKVVLVAPV